MTFPTLLLAFVISLLCGALFHFFRNGNGWRLLYYFSISLLGFIIGQWVHRWQGWNLIRFGSLDIGLGVVGCLMFLLLGDWLSRIEVNKENGV